MKTHVLKGSKQEIADSLLRIAGEVREVIVFEDESAPAAADGAVPGAEDIFAEMTPFMVNIRDVDDSREAVYTRAEGESSSSI